MGTLVLGSGRAREEQKARALLLPSIPRQLSRKHLGPLSVPPFTPPSEPPQVTDALSVATLVARMLLVPALRIIALNLRTELVRGVAQNSAHGRRDRGCERSAPVPRQKCVAV